MIRFSPENTLPVYLQTLLHPGTYYARRFLGGNRLGIGRVARRTIQLCPGRRFRAHSPFHLEDHYDRIRATPNYTPRQIVDEHLCRRTIDFPPLSVHWVDDAWFIDGSLYVAGAQRVELGSIYSPKSVLRRLLPPWVSPFEQLDDGVLVGGCAGASWFGHWLEDDLPALTLAREYGKPVGASRPAYRHEAGYLAELGFEAPQAIGVGRVDSLVIIEEFAQNPHKTRRYAGLRRTLAAREGRERVYLYRGDSGSPRRMVNEAVLAERLAREGFQIVDIGRASFRDIAAACRGAAVVAGIEGSHLAHALFMMRDYGTLLILSPPNQVHTTVADIGVFCRLASGLFVCAGADGQGGFIADPDEVLGFLDPLLRASAAGRPELAAYVDEVVALADADDNR
ncbi:MAG: glycosyltransferase family 61 protein [Sulfuritalea sp.]|nr:glycosyltransferase family 61 protein [Sulfuritalea sp.]